MECPTPTPGADIIAMDFSPFGTDSATDAHVTHTVESMDFASHEIDPSLLAMLAADDPDDASYFSTSLDEMYFNTLDPDIVIPSLAELCEAESPSSAPPEAPPQPQHQQHTTAPASARSPGRRKRPDRHMPDRSEEIGPEVRAKIDETISTLTPLLGFRVRYRPYPTLQGRVVRLEPPKTYNHRTTNFVLIRIEYPFGQEILWATPSGASKQCLLDSVLLTGSAPKFLSGPDGGSSNGYNCLQYLRGDGQWGTLLDLFPVALRSGRSSILDVLHALSLGGSPTDTVPCSLSPEDRAKLLDLPCSRDFLPRPPTVHDPPLPGPEHEYRRTPIEGAEYLIRFLPDMADSIRDAVEDRGSSRSEYARRVKPSAKSRVPRVPASPRTPSRGSVGSPNARSRRFSPPVRSPDGAAPEASEEPTARPEGTSRRRTVAIPDPPADAPSASSSSGTAAHATRCSTFHGRHPCDDRIHIRLEVGGLDRIARSRNPTPFPLTYPCVLPAEYAEKTVRCCSLDCQTEFSVPHQDAVMYGAMGVDDDGVLAEGFVCPNHPEIHRYCRLCVLSAIPDSGGPVWCPGTADVPLDRRLSVSTPCDFMFPAPFLSNLLLPRGDASQEDEREFLSSVRSKAEAFVEDLKVRRLCKVDRRHCLLVCPCCGCCHSKRRDDGAVDPVVDCQRCATTFCDACHIALPKVEQVRRHRANCRKQRHSSWILPPAELLSDFKRHREIHTASGLLEDLYLRCAEIITVDVCQRGTHQRCPTCGESRNLWEKQGPVAGCTVVADCPCRVMWCYLCERVLPRDALQERIARHIAGKMGPPDELVAPLHPVSTAEPCERFHHHGWVQAPAADYPCAEPSRHADRCPLNFGDLFGGSPCWKANLRRFHRQRLLALVGFALTSLMRRGTDKKEVFRDAVEILRRCPPSVRATFVGAAESVHPGAGAVLGTAGSA